jgi:hypothetical protein
MPLSLSVSKLDKEKRQLYVIRDGNEIVARAATRVTAIGEVRFSDLYVEPAYRRKGLAAQIIKEVRLKNKGKPITLRARPFGQKGLPLEDLKDFYRNLGFEDESKAEDRMIIKKAACLSLSKLAALAGSRRALFKSFLDSFVRNEPPLMNLPVIRSAVRGVDTASPTMSRRAFMPLMGTAAVVSPGLAKYMVTPPLTAVSTLINHPFLPARTVDKLYDPLSGFSSWLRKRLGLGAQNSAYSLAKRGAIEGLPDRTRFGKTEDIPTAQALRLVLQEHLAKRSGKHTDIRLGPQTGMHWSWATKKGPLPRPGEKLLWHQQPLHTAPYADFEGELKSGYGAGTVRKAGDEKISVSEATPDKIKFTVISKGDPEYYTLVRSDYGPKTPKTERERYSQGGSWLIINTTPTSASSFLGIEPAKMAKIKYKRVPAAEVDKLFQEGNIVQNKIDGSSLLYKLFGNRIEAISYRTDKSGAPIVHTQRLFGLGGANAKLPKEMEGMVLRGEAYGVRDGKAIPPQELGGLLNSSVMKSLAKQRASGTQMKNMLFDIVGEEDKPYAERLQSLQRVAESLPKDRFHLPESATKPEEQRKLWEGISQGKNPLTSEGIVVRPDKGKPIKVKVLPESDVWIKNVFKGEGRLSGSAGGFDYSTSPEGEVVGRVGTGLTDESRREMSQEPDKWLGRMARIRSQGQFPSGAHRAPSFIARHEDYAPVKQAAAELPFSSARIQNLNQVLAEIRLRPQSLAQPRVSLDNA